MTSVEGENTLKWLKKSREAVTKFRDALNEGFDNWTLNSDKNDVKSYSSPGEGGVIRIKATGDIPFSP